MKVIWTPRAVSDLWRLHDFLEVHSPRAAANVVQMLSRAPDRLEEFPRIGLRLEEFEGAEIRRLVVGDYDIRYQVSDDAVFVLQIWHGKEDR